MKKIKTINLLAIIIAVVFIFSVAIYVAKRPNIILFYGQDCVHCQKVADYIAAENIKDKVKFRELEVSQNQNNAALMLAKAKSCQLDTSQGLGVPFLFDGQNCLTGDEPIISFLKEKAAK